MYVHVCTGSQLCDFWTVIERGVCEEVQVRTCRGQKTHEKREAWKEGVVLLVFVTTLGDAHKEDGIPHHQTL